MQEGSLAAFPSKLATLVKQTLFSPAGRKEGKKERTPGLTRQRQKQERKAELTGSIPKPFQSNNKSLLQSLLSRKNPKKFTGKNSFR
jgi:hypothetical protein